LAGGTPGQAVLVAGAETAAGALPGALLGLVTVLFGRLLLGGPDADGRLPLPTDVLPSVPLTAGIVLLVPVFAGLLGAFLMRGVIVTPLGVVRRTRTRPPRLWPGVLLVLGGVMPFGNSAAGPPLSGLPTSLQFLFMGAIVSMAVLGVVVGTGWISYTAGRVLLRFGGRPAMLLAGRQLIAAPWAGSRNFAALLAGLFVASAALITRQGYLIQYEAIARAHDLVPGVIWYSTADEDLVVRIFELVTAAVIVAMLTSVTGVMVALTEGLVSRRRASAALVASGVPRRTLGEALAWQTMTPLVPAVLVAIWVGRQFLTGFGALDRKVTGGGSTELGCYTSEPQCSATTPLDAQVWEDVNVPEVTLAVPVPLGDLVLLAGGTVAAMLVVVGVGLVFLRMSTDLEELRVG
jgi:hypothetical protein